jgi:hypothetical protein
MSKPNLGGTTMKCGKAGFMGLFLILMVTAGAPVLSAEAVHVTWNMITVSFTPAPHLNPGGSAQAIASDNSIITITGSGTFATSESERESSRAVTGGGTWTIVSGSGTTAGAFVVTELVRWEQSTPFAGFGITDNVGDINKAFGGLAVLRVAYSDGSQGILTISCQAPADPPAIFEGMIVSKGVIQYWDPGMTFFSLFHVLGRQRDE